LQTKSFVKGEPGAKVIKNREERARIKLIK